MPDRFIPLKADGTLPALVVNVINQLVAAGVLTETQARQTADTALQTAVNGKASSSDLTTGLAGKASTGDLTTGLAGKVSTSRTVAGKPLTADVTLAPSDIGAATSAQGSKADTAVQPAYVYDRATSDARYPVLDGGGKVPTSTLPALSLVSVTTVANAAARRAQTTSQVQPGDVTVQTSTGQTYILAATDPSVDGNWVEIPAVGKVQSVNGQQGVIVLSAADVGAVPTTRTVAGKPLSADVSLVVGDVTGAASTASVQANTDALTLRSLQDLAIASPGALTAGRTNVVTAAGTYTAPAPQGTVGNPAQRFAIRNDGTAPITLSYPDGSGNSLNLTILVGMARVYRQVSASGYGLEDGIPLGQMDGRYRTFDPRNYGALIDGVYITDAAVTLGQNTLTTATTFTTADVGKLVDVDNAGTPTNVGTVSADRTSGTAYTTIPLSSALTAPVYYGPVVLNTGTSYQVVQCLGADTGATSLPCSSYTPTTTYAAGSTVLVPTTLATSIASVTGGVATLADPAGLTVTAGLACVGSNDTTAWQAALAAAAVKGGQVNHVGGISLVTSQLVVAGGVTLNGAGIDYSSTVGGFAAASIGKGTPQRGSVIRAHGTFDTTKALVKVGTIPYPNTGWGNPGNTGGSVHRIALDAGRTAQSALQTIGPRSRVSHCEIRNGLTYAFDCSGQNTMVSNCVIDNGAAGVASLLVNAHDCKIAGPGEIRPAGSYEVLFTSESGNSIMQGQDVFGKAESQVLNYVVGILCTTSFSGISLLNNHLNNPSPTGSICYLKVNTSQTFTGLNISNNRFYNDNGTPWGLLLDLPATGNSLIGLTMVANNQNPLSSYMSGLVARKGSQGIVLLSTIVGNALASASAMFGGGFVATTQYGNVGRTNGGVAYQTTQESSSTFTGDGTTAAFTVTHAIGTAPTTVQISPTTAAAVGAYVSAKAAANFTITFPTAPANATSLKFDWAAKA